MKLKKDPIDKINHLMSAHFQLLLQIKHLTIDKAEFVKEHEATTNLINDLKDQKENALESIRISLERRYFSQMRKTRNSVNKIHKKMKTAFDVKGMAEYRSFNQGSLKSLKQNFKFLSQSKISLIHEFKPPFFNLSKPNKSKKKRRGRRRAPHFSQYETDLLELGLKEYGRSITPKSPRKRAFGGGLPDWESIKNRYFPHKTVGYLQSTLIRLRKQSESNENIGNASNNFADFGRMRNRAKPMSEAEKETLLKGIGIFGLKDWASISKQLLPNWTRIELRKIYYRKIKPKMKEGEEEELVRRFAEKNGDNDIMLPIPIEYDDYNVNECELPRFPHFTHLQEVKIMNDPVLVHKLRKQIAEIMQKRAEMMPYGQGKIDFYNPSLDKMNVDGGVGDAENENDDFEALL